MTPERELRERLERLMAEKWDNHPRELKNWDAADHAYADCAQDVRKLLAAAPAARRENAMGHDYYLSRDGITPVTYRESLEHVVAVASGELQVAEDNTSGMAYIDKYARKVLAAAPAPTPAPPTTDLDLDRLRERNRHNRPAEPAVPEREQQFNRLVDELVRGRCPLCPRLDPCAECLENARQDILAAAPLIDFVTNLRLILTNAGKHSVL